MAKDLEYGAHFFQRRAMRLKRLVLPTTARCGPVRCMGSLRSLLARFGFLRAWNDGQGASFADRLAVSGPVMAGVGEDAAVPDRGIENQQGV